MTSLCEYFTRYGNAGVPDECRAPARLEMIDNGIPRIRVCHTHAEKIVSRFPELGDISQRFAPIVEKP